MGACLYIITTYVHIMGFPTHTVGAGVMVNSSSDALTINGQDGAAACEAVVSWLEAQALGTRKVNYKLRDWLFARQVRCRC
jgi:leucyl-tRNA synthetase